MPQKKLGKSHKNDVVEVETVNYIYQRTERMRDRPQINLLYMFTTGGDIGCPVYYKQYLGSTLDASAFSDMLKESTAYTDNCTVIADKGFASGGDFALLEECGLNYVIPLKRENRFVKGHVPTSPFGYEEAFSFNGRGIHVLTIPGDGFNIHLFLDTELKKFGSIQKT